MREKKALLSVGNIQPTAGPISSIDLGSKTGEKLHYNSNISRQPPRDDKFSDTHSQFGNIIKYMVKQRCFLIIPWVSQWVQVMRRRKKCQNVNVQQNRFHGHADIRFPIQISLLLFITMRPIVPQAADIFGDLTPSRANAAIFLTNLFGFSIILPVF